MYSNDCNSLTDCSEPYSLGGYNGYNYDSRKNQHTFHYISLPGILLYKMSLFTDILLEF